MVGNTVVLKPASSTMQWGIEIEKTFDKAGVPQGIFRTFVGNPSMTEALIDAEGVNAITFTLIIIGTGLAYEISRSPLFTKKTGYILIYLYLFSL